VDDSIAEVVVELAMEGVEGAALLVGTDDSEVDATTVELDVLLVLDVAADELAVLDVE
jgi:hypothetical protein